MDANGKVTGIAVGTAIITGTTVSHGKTTVCAVTVLPADYPLTVESGTGGGTFANATSKITTFTMPRNAVTVEATYRDYHAATKSQLTYNLTARTYNGKRQGVAVTPKADIGPIAVWYKGAGLTKYTKSETRPVNVGSYTVVVDIGGGKDYYAKMNLSLGTFKITKADISKVGVGMANQPWTGKQIKPTKFAYDGKNFSIRLNTTVKAYGANKQIGKGSVKLTGKGSFMGTKTIKFQIVPQKNAVFKLTVGAKKMTVAWSRPNKIAQGITKYQVRYRVAGTATWTTKTYAASAGSKTITGLKQGARYNVQVRSYKTVSNVNYYSAWSKTATTAKIQ